MKRFNRRDAARQTARTQALARPPLTLRITLRPRRRANRWGDARERRARPDAEWGQGAREL